MRREAVVVPLLLSVLAVAPGGAHAASQTGTVVRVIDGDSVRLAVNGRQTTVDLLGVRAPRGGECFAAQSKAALARILRRGKRVRIETDRERRSGRGRYVFAGRSLVNAALLRAGAARLASTTGLRRGATLRSAARQAEGARRGLFGACAGGGAPGGSIGGGGAPSPPAPPPPPPPRPSAPPEPSQVENAERVRTLLTGRRLEDFRSDDSGNQDVNETDFCAGGRTFRRETFNGTSGTLITDVTGTWAVLGVLRQADGTLLAEIFIFPDDTEISPRQFVIRVAPDGTITRADRTSQTVSGNDCGPAPATAPLENNTAAARQTAANAVLGKRLDEGAANATTDFCDSSRAIRREGGTAVLNAPWTIEYAVSHPDVFIAAIAIADPVTKAARRLFVGQLTGQAPQVRRLDGTEQELRDASFGPLAC